MKKLVVCCLFLCLVGCRRAPQEAPPPEPEPVPTNPDTLDPKKEAESLNTKANERLVSDWIADLKSEDTKNYNEALKALGSVGPKACAAIPILRERLVDTGPGTSKYRVQILSVLGSIGPDARLAAPEIIQKLSSEDTSIVDACKETLTKIGSPVVPALITGLKDETANRAAVAAVVGNMGDKAKEAIPALIDLLKSAKSPTLRTQVAIALGKMGPTAKDALPELKKLSTDMDMSVQKSAKDAIDQIEGKKE